MWIGTATHGYLLFKQNKNELEQEQELRNPNALRDENEYIFERYPLISLTQLRLVLCFGSAATATAIVTTMAANRQSNHGIFLHRPREAGIRGPTDRQEIQ